MPLLLVLLIGMTCLGKAYGEVPQTLRFVYMEDYAPFCFRDVNGKVIGIQPEIVDDLARRLGIRVEHSLYPWKRSQALVQQGLADAMLTTPTASRFQYAVFTREETTPNLWNLFIRKGDTRMEKAVEGFRQLEDVKPYRLLDFLGNGWTQAFMKPEQGYTNIDFIPNPASLSVMLANGRGDLVLTSSTVMNYHARNQGVADQIKEIDINWHWTRFHQVIQISRASPWAKTGIIKGLDNAARAMKEDGTYRRILKKYGSRVADGYPFVSQLDEAYLEKNGFYADYDTLPEWQPDQRMQALSQSAPLNRQ